METVTTVLGPISRDALGITLAHEHLLIDLRVWWKAPVSAERAHIVDAEVTLDRRGELVVDPYESKENLQLDDVDAAVAEIRKFGELGGSTVIDLSSRSIGPYPAQLAEISRRSGVHVVASTGLYIRHAHPAWVADVSVDEIADRMVRELTEGYVEAPGIRAGIIGEIGTSTPVHAQEEKALRAAARAQRRTGAAINVHLAIFAREGHRALDILEEEGAALDRVALSHLDEQLDASYHLSLARRGAYIEYDTFGAESEFQSAGERQSKDTERVDLLLALLDAGLERQILMSQDVCMRVQLTRFGGKGYGHVLRSIVPHLRGRGVSEAQLQVLLRENPARLLTGQA